MRYNGQGFKVNVLTRTYREKRGYSTSHIQLEKKAAIARNDFFI